MKPLVIAVPLLLCLACSPKPTEKTPAEVLALAEAGLAGGQLDQAFVQAQGTLAGLCKKGAAPPDTALEAFVLRAETGTVLLLSAYITQDPQLVALLTSAFGFTVQGSMRETRTFQTLAQNFSELAAVVLRRSGQGSPLALRASRISNFLAAIQTISFTKQAMLCEALSSLDSAGPFERRLAALGHLVLLTSFAPQPDYSPSWRHVVVGLLGPVCPKAVEPVAAVLCVPSKDPKVYGECEAEVAAIPQETKLRASKTLEQLCPGEGPALERVSGRFVALLQAVAADQALDHRVRTWADQTLASDLPKLEKLKTLLPPQ